MSAAMTAAEAREFAFAVAIGPVGSFIGGGRRSRDLWYGSRFLSEVTRRAAEALRDAGAVLAVPLENRLDVEFFPSHRGPTISNKILGWLRVGTAADVEKLITDARTRALKFVTHQMARMQQDRRFRFIALQSAIGREIEAVEHGDFVEFYAAWTVSAGGQEEQALKRALVLLDARKQARAFGAPQSRPGVPKSALDPGRDSVLREVDLVRDPALATRLMAERTLAGVLPEERLDTISLVRRWAAFMGTDAVLPRLPFPSLHRVTADAWLQGAELLVPDVLDTLRRRLEGAGEELYLFSSRCREYGLGRDEPRFPFDPSMVMENGVETLLQRLDVKQRARMGQVFPSDEGAGADEPHVSADLVERARDALNGMRRHVEKLHGTLGVPQPYYALLEADGDGVGARLMAVKPEERSRLVQALYDFADNAWKIVEELGGCAFYTGGDEVLAYLPLDRALDVAQRLTDAFAQKMEQIGEVELTLSVGLVVGHVKDDLRATRRRAHRALDRAKAARKRAGSKVGWIWVHEEPRAGIGRGSGGRARDEEGTQGYLRTIAEWRKDLRSERISRGTAHGLLELREHFDLRGDGDDDDESAGGHSAGTEPVGLMLARSAVVDRARRRGEEDIPEPLQTRVNALRSWRDVHLLANELLLATRIERAAAQRRGAAAEEGV